MARVYRSICMEIDELTIKIIHLTEKLVAYKMEVEKIMNNGFVNIAKARYIMGSKCVSTLQLPTINSNPVRPLATVCRAPYEDYWVYQTSRREPTPLPSDEKILKDKINNDTTKTDFIKNILDKDSTNICKRKEFYVIEDGNYKELNEELQDEVSTDSSESTQSQVTFTDPIRLFGVLVPQTLRLAQKNFQDVINVLLHCATIQSETNVVLKRYYHLMKVKHLMESAGEERGIDLSEEIKYWTPSEKDSESSDIVTETNLVETTSKEGELELQETEEKVKDELLSSETGSELEGEVEKLTSMNITEYSEDSQFSDKDYEASLTDCSDDSMSANRIMKLHLKNLSAGLSYELGNAHLFKNGLDADVKWFECVIISHFYGLVFLRDSDDLQVLIHISI